MNDWLRTFTTILSAEAGIPWVLARDIANQNRDALRHWRADGIDPESAALEAVAWVM